MEKISMVVVLLGTLALSTTSVQAQTITFSGAQDTTFITWQPDSTYYDAGVSGEDEWEWDGEDGGGLNYGALRFDNVVGSGPGQVPPNASVVSAVITLNVVNEGDSSQIGALHELLKPFSEQGTLTDFNGGTDPAAGTDYSADIVAEIPGPSEGDVLELDVTSVVQSWANGNPNNGFMFVPGGTNGVGIQASEAASGGPVLTVTLASGPNAANFGSAVDTTFITWQPGSTYFDAGVSDEDEWEWDGSDGGGVNYGALRFAGVIGDGLGQVPSGSDISQAIITLNVVNEGDSGQIATLHEALKPFDDGSTLNDFNGGGEPAAGTDYSAEVVAEIPGPSEGDVLQIDVTSAVQGWASGNANNGFIFVPGGTNGVGIQASEAPSGGPLLSVVLGGPSRAENWQLFK